MRKRSSSLCFIVAFCAALASCSIGSARKIDVRRDLSGIDLAYLESLGSPTHDENEQHLQGRLSGWPFWFLPATLRYRGTNALHQGDLAEPEGEGEGDGATPMGELTGYEHTTGSAIGLGAVHFTNRSARWDQDGNLEEWEDGWGLGFGLLYHSRHRYAAGSETYSAKILGGLLGYTGNDEQGHLHLLWIPIPW
ncbi:MAG TPA: hypothetical protein ENI87_12805 [bacterium]|nr:hypothetical protein [bacterium]